MITKNYLSCIVLALGQLVCTSVYGGDDAGSDGSQFAQVGKVSPRDGWEEVPRGGGDGGRGLQCFRKGDLWWHQLDSGEWQQYGLNDTPIGSPVSQPNWVVGASNPTVQNPTAQMGSNSGGASVGNSGNVFSTTGANSLPELSRIPVDRSKSITLQMLASLSSLGYVMSGQHNDEKKPDVTAYTNDVQRITGKYPGLWSGDFLFEANDQRRWAVVREAENQWRNDAIINLMWHACPPTQGESCGWDGGVQSKLSDQQWNDLITDGGNLNRVWKQRMDSIAVYLQYLKEKGVEVMWRPLHEMNQGAFWWGGRPGANGTRRLYQLTHDYMVDQKGLTNLIWVWNVQDLSTDYAAYNPGNAYWDVATLDVYGSGLSERSYYDALMQQVGNKIVGIGETFKLPTENAFKQFPRFSFFMIWAYGLENDNSRQEIINAYSNPRVITRDEITSMKRK